MTRPYKSKTEEVKKPFTILLNTNVIDDIERLAKKLHLSRNQMCNNLIALGLDELKGMERLGIVSIVGTYRNLVEQFGETEFSLCIVEKSKLSGARI